MIKVVLSFCTCEKSNTTDYDKPEINPTKVEALVALLSVDIVDK